jgi:hypothetical protein
MNLDPVALITNLRAYLVGFAVWLAVDQAAGWRASEATAGGGARGMGAFFGILLIVRMVRILWPMRTVGDSKLVAGGRTLTVYSFTGRSSDVEVTSETTNDTHGTVWNVGSTVSGVIRTDTHTRRRQRFFLTGADGVARGFELRHDQVMLGRNQWVTALWAVAPLRRRGRHVAFVNHTQGTTAFPGNELAALAMGGSPGLAALWAFLTLVCFVAGGSGSGTLLGLLGLAFLVVASRLQAGFFRTVGSRPLVARMAEEHTTPDRTSTPTTPTPPATGSSAAVTPPATGAALPAVGTTAAPGPDPVARLSELSRLLSQGDITPDEYAQLKARIISDGTATA